MWWHRLMRTIALIGLLSFTLAATAQNEPFEQFHKRRRDTFSRFNEQRQKRFDEFRRKRNEEFANFLRERWKPAVPSPIIPRPKDEDVPPVLIPKEDLNPLPPAPTPMPHDEVVPVPKPKRQPAPIEPIEEIPVTPVSPVIAEQAFTFFGTEGVVRFDKKHAISLPRLDENAVADAWLKLSEETYTNLVHDCLQIREKHRLCDWAYLMMLQSMAETICGEGTDEATLLMAYVYCQSGYKMRLGICSNRLQMMFTSEHLIYNWSYYLIEGDKYYPFNKKAGDIRICKQEFPNEQPMSLVIQDEPIFDMVQTSVSQHQSKRDEDIHVEMVANQNMLDFYSSYPTSALYGNSVTRWALYANMPMPSYVKEQVYTQLEKSVKGVDQIVAVNRILNWVQTGFAYEYDDKVWGEDRAFFPEESLFYPYCDCEDRSILLTRIIRDILGLRCVLIYSPGHLAAAVEITEGNPSGDYIEYQGRRFYVADGAIMGYGAPLGQAMDGMGNHAIKVVPLD